MEKQIFSYKKGDSISFSLTHSLTLNKKYAEIRMIKTLSR